jgi:hypothetical protein
MIATAISKRVEIDHVIAYRATDLVYLGLHELTLYLNKFVHVHPCAFSGQPEDGQKEIKIFIAAEARAQCEGKLRLRLTPYPRPKPNVQ